MREELKVVRIEAVEGAAIQKTLYPRKGYSVKVTRTLSDGKQYPCSERAEKLKDLKAKLAELPREVSNEKATVENGIITMIATSYSLTGRGLEPSLVE